MDYIIVLISLTALVIGIVLVFLNRQFNIRLKRAGIRRINISTKNLLRTTVSYEKYKAISNRTSIRNSPVRESGDFLDFFLSFSEKSTSNAIEGKLAAMDCGEIYE